MVYPAHFSLSSVIRPNILSLTPYRCARDDYSEGILLDANENAFGSSISSPSTSSTSSTIDSESAQDIPSELLPTLSLDLHRYPDPSHPLIKSRIAALRELPSTDYVFLGVGSDEIIDLLMRVCVVPGGEKILTTPPTYGMYAVCAQVNDVGVVKVPLELSGEQGEGGEEGRFSIKVDEVCPYIFYEARTVFRNKTNLYRSGSRSPPTLPSNLSFSARQAIPPEHSYPSVPSAHY